jgi:hypothetical protein
MEFGLIVFGLLVGHMAPALAQVIRICSIATVTVALVS